MFEGILNTPLQYRISLQMRLTKFTGHMKKAKKNESLELNFP